MTTATKAATATETASSHGSVFGAGEQRPAMPIAAASPPAAVVHCG
jgi:hypothetical protein